MRSIPDELKDFRHSTENLEAKPLPTEEYSKLFPFLYPENVLEVVALTPSTGGYRQPFRGGTASFVQSERMKRGKPQWTGGYGVPRTAELENIKRDVLFVYALLEEANLGKLTRRLQFNPT